MTSIAALVLAPLAYRQAVPLPTYDLKDGEVLKFKVKGKAEVQPYGIGGVLTLKFKEKTPGKLWTVEMNHDMVMEAEGQTAPGGQQASVWEMTPELNPTGTGEGAQMFGPQLLACLVLPSQEKQVFAMFDARTPFVTTATKVENFIKVTSVVQEPTATHTIERFLDAKTRKLVKAKCVSKNVAFSINYELLPIK